MDIPREKIYPPDAVQCARCGGHGCSGCQTRGWYGRGHPWGRLCAYRECDVPVPPAQVAIYCSNACALADA